MLKIFIAGLSFGKSKNFIMLYAQKALESEIKYKWKCTKEYVNYERII